MARKKKAISSIENDDTLLGRIFEGWLILDWSGRQPRVVTTETGLRKNMKPKSFAVKYKVTVHPPVIPTIESEENLLLSLRNSLLGTVKIV